MNAEQLITQSYDSVSTWYDAWQWQHFWSLNEEPLIRASIAQTKGSHRALDFGTGTGRYADILRDWGFCTYGLDSSDKMIEVAESKLKGRAKLLHGSSSSKIFPGSYFDIAIAARVFCHIENIDASFQEIAHTVTTGGTFILTELDHEHAYEKTRIPTPNGKVCIPTWKRSVHDLVRSAENAGWCIKSHQRIFTSDCLLPPQNGRLNSIDRSKNKPIFNVLSFSKR